MSSKAAGYRVEPPVPGHAEGVTRWGEGSGHAGTQHTPPSNDIDLSYRAYIKRADMQPATGQPVQRPAGQLYYGDGSPYVPPTEQQTQQHNVTDSICDVSVWGIPDAVKTLDDVGCSDRGSNGGYKSNTE